jgi:ribosomal protein S18 acetylase RimI-like enzyme
MTSAATEREINKWRLWGVHKFLEANACLALHPELQGQPPTLDLVKLMGLEDTEDTETLLKEAHSSLKNMEIRWVILGACNFVDEFPLRMSKEHGDSRLNHDDVFCTFGKKSKQGERLYLEAHEDYLRFRKVRDINTLSRLEFAKRYLSSVSMNYTCFPRSANAQSGGATANAAVSFKISLEKSCDIFVGHDGKKETPDTLGVTSKTLFELVKHTSYDHYNTSRDGWNDNHKIGEMKDDDMRYLVVRLEHGNPPHARKRWSDNPDLDHSIIGFVSFMITQEEEENVVYVYEIHISEHFRSCGLGNYLFGLIDAIGESTGMDKVMLTVYKRNTHAREWYAYLSYKEDEISPRPRKLRGGRSVEPDYEILSKRLYNSRHSPSALQNRL